MSEEEKRAIKEIKDILKYWQTIVDIEDDDLREIEMSLYCEEMPFNQMKILLNALDKKDKVIDLMVKEISMSGKSIEIINLYNNVSPDSPIYDLVKEYFYKKAGEEDD